MCDRRSPTATTSHADTSLTSRPAAIYPCTVHPASRASDTLERACLTSRAEAPTCWSMSRGNLRPFGGAVLGFNVSRA